MTQTTLFPELRISPRRAIRPGTTFRTLRGSGPQHHGEGIGMYAKFRAVRLYQTGRRLYCLAICLRTGATHDLYLSGRPYTSFAGTTERPYKCKIARER